MPAAKLVVDWLETRRRLRTFATKVLPYVRVTWRKIAEDVMQEVRASTPETAEGRTAIRDLWQLTEESPNESITNFVIENTYANQDVILWMEVGTQPHLIVPVRAQVLHFFTEEGAEVFADSVYHPGTRAWGMIGKGEEYGQAKIDQYMRETMKMIDMAMGAGATGGG